MLVYAAAAEKNIVPVDVAHKSKSIYTLQKILTPLYVAENVSIFIPCRKGLHLHTNIASIYDAENKRVPIYAAETNFSPVFGGEKVYACIQCIKITSVYSAENLAQHNKKLARILAAEKFDICIRIKKSQYI